MTRPALCVIPAFLRRESDLDLTATCLLTLRDTAPDAEVLVVDDGSADAALVGRLEAVCGELGVWFDHRPVNEGFSRTVNVGLRIAHENGCDAVLVNADVEFMDAGWLDRMRLRTDAAGRPAAVVGGRLLYPVGLLQHAGVAFSLLQRDWYHRFQFGPSDLPEALVPTACPVTAALQLIRWEALDRVGVYDEGYRMCFEDVDYCLRVFAAGQECVYEPSVRAWHHESAFRRAVKDAKVQRWTAESTARMWTKWAAADLGRWVAAAL